MFVFVLCNYWHNLAYSNKIWLLTYLYIELSIFALFLRMPTKGACDLTLASKKPLLAFRDGF